MTPGIPTESPISLLLDRPAPSPLADPAQVTFQEHLRAEPPARPRSQATNANEAAPQPPADGRPTDVTQTESDSLGASEESDDAAEAEDEAPASDQTAQPIAATAPSTGQPSDETLPPGEPLSEDAAEQSRVPHAPKESSAESGAGQDAAPTNASERRSLPPEQSPHGDQEPQAADSVNASAATDNPQADSAAAPIEPARDAKRNARAEGEAKEPSIARRTKGDGAHIASERVNEPSSETPLETPPDFSPATDAGRGDAAQGDSVREAAANVRSTTPRGEQFAAMESGAGRDAGESSGDSAPPPEPTAPESSEAGENAPRLAAADRVRFVQRVARAIEAARPDGEIRLRLRPPELGSMQLRMKMEDGALIARVETETAEARSLLAEHLPELRERLAELNIRVERFDVEWRGGGSDGQTQSSPQRHFSGDGAPFRQTQSNQNEHSPSEPAPQPSRARRNHQGDLDVLV